MRVGYARVSTTSQNLDMQIEALNKAGCEKIYTEKESGVKERPVLKELLSFIRQGDTLVVYKLDRLGRSVRELLAMVDDLREKGISLIALQDNIDATTPGGKMMMQMMAILAEYERNLIIERCQTGRKEPNGFVGKNGTMNGAKRNPVIIRRLVENARNTAMLPSNFVPGEVKIPMSGDLVTSTTA